MTEEQERDYIGEMFARMDSLQASASVNAVFGQPVTAGDKVIIPMATVQYGLGFGFGEGTGQMADKAGVGTGGGWGGGVSAKPLGLVEITPERTRIEPVVNEQTLALAGMLLAAWSVFWISRTVLKILRR